MSTREAFEQFMSHSRRNRGVKKAAELLNKFDDGTYINEHVQRHWWTWQQARAALSGWLPIETAPKDGTRFIAYRPLALRTHDPEVSLVQGSEYDRGCWDSTVPEGMDSSNFTSGYCKATHWMPLPELPNQGTTS